LTRRGDASVISADGTLDGPTCETVRDALGFVPIDDHVILDLSRLEATVTSLARRLADVVGTSPHRDVVVVTPRDDLQLVLLLADSNAVVAVVARCEDAVRLVRRRARAGADAPLT
jgi:predicted regulator of Ras-like GTPase activity (Roadblock/LC7/MglB family)